MQVKRYKVRFTVNWELYEEEFSCIMDIKPEIEINTDLDDRFFWEDREVLEIKPL